MLPLDSKIGMRTRNGGSQSNRRTVSRSFQRYILPPPIIPDALYSLYGDQAAPGNRARCPASLMGLRVCIEVPVTVSVGAEIGT